jgi:multidrug efflux pump subunit AcrB
MVKYLLRSHPGGHEREIMEEHDAEAGRKSSRNPLVRFQHSFEGWFEKVRLGYRDLLMLAMENRRIFIIGFMTVVLLSFGLVPFLGRNFFPTVDAGEINLHVRAPVGTRIEETAALFDHVEASIRRTIPADELGTIVDNIGLPVSGINRAYANTGGVGPMDGDILVTLNEDHRPTADYVKSLRTRLPREFPGSTFSFLPADIISQILNFGAPAPIDLQVAGPNAGANQAYAEELRDRISRVPGVADARLEQATNYPEFRVTIDRARASQLGLTERDVTNTLSTTFAGSFQIAPAFWLNPKTGVSYPIVAQTPQYQIDTMSDLENVPITSITAGSMQILGGLGTITRDEMPAVISHYAVEPSFDVFATTQGRDLGGVASDIQKIIAATAHDRPRGATVHLRGQVTTMNTAFADLLFGLMAAIVLIYLLIVVNFQSWLDPFVIITALPAALAGIVWILFATHTTLSVPALTGAIMCMGVATANSILVVSFAREQLDLLGSGVEAAVEAGVTRFRPVLMTALAMIIGMAPMALALGEGGEQNAPLGRAVIGGLLFATFATLLFVPVVFSLVHGEKQPAAKPSLPGEAYHAH